MVILAITPDGLRQALQLPQSSSISIWRGSDAISEQEFKALPNGYVSRFEYPFAHMDAETLSSVVGTIEEHHPAEMICVEHVLPS